MSDVQAAYDELAEILANLPLLARETRRQRRLSLRAASAQMGFSDATLLNIERGKDCWLSNAVRILRWLDGGAS